MSAKPTDVPRHCLTAGGVDGSNINTPSSGEQDTGFTNGQNPVSSGKLNWALNRLCRWAGFLNDSPVFVPTTTNAPGLSATGNGTGPGLQGTGGSASAPGVKAVAGGGGSPQRGAINLAVQIGPGTPSDGDLWITTGFFNAQIGGAKMQVADAGKPAFAQFTYVGNPGNAASTNYFAWAGASQGAPATNGTARANGQTTHMVAVTGGNGAIRVRTGQLTAGGTVTIQPMINGVPTGGTISIPAGTAAGTSFTLTFGAGNLVSQGDILELEIINGAGVTASIGLSLMTWALNQAV